MKHPITNSELNHQWSATLSKRSGAEIEVRTINLAKSCGLEGEQVTTIINALYPVLPNKSIKARTQAVKAILLNLLRASIETERTGQLTGFLHCRTTAGYKLPKRYSVNSFSDKTMTKVLDDMALHGLVACHKGFKGRDHIKGLASFWYPTEVFRALISGWLSKDLTVIWFNAEIELVELKDLSDTLIDYSDNSQTLSIRQAVSNTNEIRLAHTWHYIPETTAKTPQNTLQDLISEKSYVTIAPQELMCTRKFKGDFSTGGRFYANYQQLSKAERATITIDGKSTVELDIKSAQPRILYNLKGLESPEDCYQIGDIPRAVVKAMMIVSLNAETKEQAVRALCTELKMKRDEVLVCLDQILEYHTPIADSFFTESWKVVQYQDSELTNDILMVALAKSIAVLPVHDSYIVDANHQSQMLGIIKTAYRKRFGFDCVVEY